MVSTQATQNIPIAAYEVGTVHRFQVVMVHRRTGEERCELIQLDSDRFCNVLAEVNRRFPRWAIVESWEVTLTA